MILKLFNDAVSPSVGAAYNLEWYWKIIMNAVWAMILKETVAVHIRTCYLPNTELHQNSHAGLLGTEYDQLKVGR
jgi:hypothetical protein